MHLGIDFGTSYTKIACFYDNKLINLAGGKKHIPSAACYVPGNGKLYFGDLALRINEADAVMALFFKLALKRNYGYTIGSYTLPDIITAFFAFLRDEYIFSSGLEVDSITLSVPNYFGLNARQVLVSALKEVFQIERVFLLPEPLAAVLGLHKFSLSAAIEGDILVADLGGGTSDFSFLSVFNQGHDFILETQLQIGNDAFSGSELDRGIVRNILSPLFQMNTGQSFPYHLLEEKNLSAQDKYVLNNLLGQAEQLKIEISTSSLVSRHIPDLYHGSSLQILLTASLFQEKLAFVYKRLEEYLQGVLKQRAQQLGIYGNGIWRLENIVLLGGASQSRGIKDLFKTIFKDTHIFLPEDPEFSVVKGCSIYNPAKRDIALSIKNIYPFDFYIEKQEGKNKRLEKIPFDTQNLELDITGRYKIFSFSTHSPYNLKQHSGGLGVRVYEKSEEIDRASLQRFAGQELVLDYDCKPECIMSDYVNLYFNLSASRLELDFSQAATASYESMNTFTDVLSKQKEGLSFLSGYEFYSPRLKNDYEKHLEKIEANAVKPYENHLETSLYKLMTLLQVLSGK